MPRLGDFLSNYRTLKHVIDRKNSFDQRQSSQNLTYCLHLYDGMTAWWTEVKKLQNIFVWTTSREGSKGSKLQWNFCWPNRGHTTVDQKIAQPLMLKPNASPPNDTQNFDFLKAHIILKLYKWRWIWCLFWNG